MIFRVFAITILVAVTGSFTDSHSAGADGIQLAQTTSTDDALSGTGDDTPTAQSQTQAQPPAQSSVKNTAAPTLQEFLSDTRPVESLPVSELRAKLRDGRALIKGGSLSRPDRKRVASVLRVTRAQLNKVRPSRASKLKKPVAGPSQPNDPATLSPNPDQ